MRTLALLSTVCLLVIHTARAWAQSPTCVAGSPGSVACAPALVPGQPPEAPAAAPDTGGLTTRTHSFFLPTGNVVPAGRVAVRVHGLGAYNTIAYGLHDRIELSASAPAVPIISSFGARLSLLPADSPLKAVVGASVWLPLMMTTDEPVYLTHTTATVAFQTESVNIHATLGRLHTNQDDDALLMGSAGITIATSEKYALMADISSVSFGQTVCAADGGGCSSPDLWDLSSFGVKYMGKKWDVDAGVFMHVDQDEQKLVFLPMLSLHRRY